MMNAASFSFPCFARLLSKQAKFCKIFKIQVFEVLLITKVFPVIVMLKLTKLHGKRGITCFDCSIFLTNTRYSDVDVSNINRKALQIG